MKKRMISKMTALLGSAVLAVSGVQSLTASAATYTTYTQSTLTSGYHMSDFVRHESMKFENGKYWNNHNNPNKCTEQGCTYHPPLNLSEYHANNFPCCAHVPMGHCFSVYYGPALDNGVDGEAYQCAGFAKKLAMDYYDTDFFLQLSYVVKDSYGNDHPASTYYYPRMGDQLHLNLNGSFHTIFVTGFDTSNGKLTFTDCNWSGNCRIRWSQTAYAFVNNGYTYVYINGIYARADNVTRPVMVGDVNGDSFVNASDYTAMQSLVSNSYNPNFAYSDLLAVMAVGDLNGDHHINQTDLNILGPNRTGILPNYGYVKGV